MLISAVSLLFVSTGFADVSAQWTGSEHFELGMRGAELACEELGIDKKNCPIHNIKRRDQKVAFTYGEIQVVADHYRKPDDLYKDDNNGIKGILKCINKVYHSHSDELEAHNEISAQSKNTLCKIALPFHMPSYIEVVTHNYDHFAWHNMKAYVRYHTLALQYAKESFEKQFSHPDESQHALERALIINAFADHYLSDSFAAGHVRVPRVEIKEWADKRLPGLFRRTRGDLLSMVLHDTEGQHLLTGEKNGLRVANSYGHVWTTRGDSHLHKPDNTVDQVFAIPLIALKESFKELLLTLKTGHLPQGEYRATVFVPFSIDVPLSERLSSIYQGMPHADIVKELHSSLPSLLRLFFSKPDVDRMVRSFDAIFAQFRKNVEHDIGTNSDLSNRLPAKYREAMVNAQ